MTNGYIGRADGPCGDDNLKAKQNCETPAGYEPKPPTLRDQAKELHNFHTRQAIKCAQTAQFLSENPAFDEFIRLIRSGAIQI